MKRLKGITLVDVGAPYPNLLLTVVLKGDLSTKQFPFTNNITIIGKVVLYKGKPQILVTDEKVIMLGGK